MIMRDFRKPSTLFMTTHPDGRRTDRASKALNAANRKRVIICAPARKPLSMARKKKVAGKARSKKKTALKGLSARKPPKKRAKAQVRPVPRPTAHSRAKRSWPPRRIVLLGPPGAGKGTQAQMLASKLGIPRYATGDMLRAAVAKGTDLGNRAREFMDRGLLVPDALVIEITAEALGSADAEGGFILDGFPRSLAQARALESIAPVDRVINIAVSGEVIKARLGGRRSCPKCGAVFHVVNKPSASGDRCDQCSTALVLRNDDKPEVVEQRLRTYMETTAPLLDHYEKQELLTEIDGSGEPREVFERLVPALEAR
jgi:adenylate kinase